MNYDLSLNKEATEKFKENFDFNGKILEIGALHNPFFLKNEVDVYYADMYSTEELIAHPNYGIPEISNNIVHVDYVISSSYNDTFKDTGIKFDYVYSSHVLEHIPDPIGFLLDISNILEKEGKLCLMIPQKEYTFDHFRENSSFAELFDMHVRGGEINTPRLFLDSILYHVDDNSPKLFWNKKNTKYPNIANAENGLNAYKKFIENYDEISFDGHHWAFTEESFLKILAL